ncbi:type IV secretion system DNA-binding domain-containing protein [Tunturiibacter lichenicola]|uniref:type IV secretion system DNA-binding domain-containing protein n=1 Tax=Tunturiibacter lichenicola TaxID=2051959 RepID=UPI003D9BF8E4
MLPFVPVGVTLKNFIAIPKELVSIRTPTPDTWTTFTAAQKKYHPMKYAYWKGAERICTISEPFLTPVVQHVLGALGIALINEEQSWIDKVMRNDLSRWARVPREREAMHFLIVGDSGTGKSVAIRQILSQVWERGEAAIVYDPAMEYLPQFYNEARGDVVLNPLDTRCPFWTPGDEVPHEAEALTLSVSLFPDQGRENRFFVEAPRKIFAHLINLRPTPEELTYWMTNADEIDKRIAGTEMAAMIEKGAANQRSGVLGSLNMVADAFKLLPRESETKQRWSTVEWAKERKGWVFLTSKPTNAGENAPAHQPVAGLACIASDE